jgi:hypothetical protein
MNRFFGGPPLAVIARLAVISVVIGILLSAIGLSPHDLLNSIQRLVWRIYNMGFEAIDWLLSYFLLGALIVVPFWFISRLWKMMSRPSSASGSNRADDYL